MSKIVIIIILVVIAVIIAFVAMYWYQEAQQAYEAAAKYEQEAGEATDEAERLEMVAELLTIAGVRSSNARSFADKYAALLMSQEDTEYKGNARKTQRLLKEQYAVQKNADIADAMGADLKRYERRAR